MASLVSANKLIGLLNIGSLVSVQSVVREVHTALFWYVLYLGGGGERISHHPDFLTMSRCRSTSSLLILKESNSGTADLLFEVNTKYSTQPGHSGLASVLLLWHLCNIDCCIRSVTGSWVSLLIEHQAHD